MHDRRPFSAAAAPCHTRRARSQAGRTTRSVVPALVRSEGVPMLLLDTASLPPEERADAFRAAFVQASAPCRIEHLGPARELRTRMHLWHYGDANLFSTDSSGFRLVRTERHVRMESPPVVALAVQSSGVG